jgi:hypothetical protein
MKFRVTTDGHPVGCTDLRSREQSDIEAADMLEALRKAEQAESESEYRYPIVSIEEIDPETGESRGGIYRQEDADDRRTASDAVYERLDEVEAQYAAKRPKYVKQIFEHASTMAADQKWWDERFRIESAHDLRNAAFNPLESAYSAETRDSTRMEQAFTYAYHDLFLNGGCDLERPAIILRLLTAIHDITSGYDGGALFDEHGEAIAA